MLGLSRAHTEAIGLLALGTFLEYFDLMLYIHMAVFLNELFFPVTDPHTATLLSAFVFCTTFIFRPFGALLFGYIGDTIKYKITNFMNSKASNFATAKHSYIKDDQMYSELIASCNATIP